MSAALVAIAVITLIAFAAGVLLYKIGKRTQQGEDVKRETSDAAIADEIRDGVARMSDDERMRALGRWVLPDREADPISGNGSDEGK